MSAKMYRYNTYYEGRDIGNIYDRIEAEKEIIEHIYEKYKSKIIPNQYLPLIFCISGVGLSTFNRAPVAVANYSGIRVYMDILDSAVNYVISHQCGIEIVDTIELALTCWDVLYAKSAFTILHEMTHARQSPNMYYMDVPSYVTTLENTAEMNALDILRNGEHLSEALVELISLETGSYENSSAIIPVDRTINNPIDYGNYYYETLKESLQIFGLISNHPNYKYIYYNLQEALFVYPSCYIADFINNQGVNEYIVIKENGVFIYPDQSYMNLLSKLYALGHNNAIADNPIKFNFYTFDDLPNTRVLGFAGSILYKPFERKGFVDSLGISDFYKNTMV